MILDFRQNVGDIERVARVIFGIAIVTLVSFDYLNFTPFVSFLVLLFGFSQIIEGAIGY